MWNSFKLLLVTFHSVIVNRVIIMDSVLNVSTKYPDKIMISFGNMFQCFGVCWVTEIYYIRISYSYKVINTLIVIVY